MTSTKQTMEKRSVDDEIGCGVKRNRFKKLLTIYNMTSTEQTMKKRSVDDEISCGVGINRFKKLPTIYNMTSTEQTMKKRNDDVDDEISNGGENGVKGLPSIYEMSLTKQTMKKRNDNADAGANLLDSLVPDINVPSMKPKQTTKKRNDNVDAGANLLDSLVPDIDVPIMKPKKSAWFKSWIQNAKCKMHEASETIKKRSMEIANWILNKKIVKSHLPAKVKELIEMVMETKYSKKKQ